ncbi:hypothetical protein [Neptuniibacter sp. QD37_11]|uniref:hypothetical protein n=1 Tax=Neptuniibacter sp. QD37_11 TaxID=3398209 RepID=UPI0039F5CD36
MELDFNAVVAVGVGGIAVMSLEEPSGVVRRDLILLGAERWWNRITVSTPQIPGMYEVKGAAKQRGSTVTYSVDQIVGKFTSIVV